MSNKELSVLRRNTMIIAIANLGSKAIGFILAPLYSFYLSTSEYGTMDLITTTAGLLMPLLCLDIYEATFRFASENDYDKKIVFSSSVSLSAAVSLCVTLITLFLKLTADLPNVVLYAVLASAIDANYMVLSWFARGDAKMKVFAFSGVVNSLFTLILNGLFLIMIKMGLHGWIASYLIAKIVACIYVIVRVKAWELFSFNYLNSKFYSSALKYCIPLLPTASMWWIMNASDRYMVAFFIGTAGNGIYAVANKLPALLSVFEGIFYQSWQTSAFNTVNDKNKENFYSSVFINYLCILVVGVLALFIVLKPFIIFLFEQSYADAWKISSILVVGVLVHALSGNIGTLYAALKKTKGALITTIVGALTNIILNFIFIPKFGLYAAATSTVVAYIVVLIYRWFDIRRYINIKISMVTVIEAFLFIMTQFVLYYIESPFSYVARVCVLACYCYLHRELFLIFTRKGNFK